MADTTTITIVIDARIDLQLARQARATGRSKPEVIREVLAEWLQDQDDYREAVEIASRNEPSSSSGDVRRRLGLDR
ncbi:MAG: ribbon-helix-helix protein, CopG family [Chloroflexota bacterium]|nr:ribbon-helix-helix protein, CopG family [Chloroflexota bacterium]